MVEPSRHLERLVRGDQAELGEAVVAPGLPFGDPRLRVPVLDGMGPGSRHQLKTLPGVSSYSSSTMRLPPHILDRPLDGVRLDGDTLREVTARGPVLLVFLRHFG